MSTSNVGKDVEKLDHLRIAGVNVKCYSHCGKTVWQFLKKLNMQLSATVYVTQQLNSWALVKRNENLCPHKSPYSFIYSSFICNSPKLKQSSVSE